MKKAILFMLFLLAFTLSAQQAGLPDAIIDRMIQEIDGGAPFEMIAQDYFEPGMPARDKAISLNTLGFRYYERGEYRTAMEIFQFSWEFDDSYVYPYYNYACCVGILAREDDNPCFPYPTQELVDALRRAVDLAERYKAKMHTDSDLEYYWGRPWFLEVSGSGLDSRWGVSDILESTPNWIGNRPGVFPTSNVSFDDGFVTISYFDQDYWNEHNEIHWDKFEGRYRVSMDGTILISMDDGRELQGRLTHAIPGYESRQSLIVYLVIDGINFFEVYGDPCSA